MWPLNYLEGGGGYNLFLSFLGMYIFLKSLFRVYSINWGNETPSLFPRGEGGVILIHIHPCILCIVHLIRNGVELNSTKPGRTERAALQYRTDLVRALIFDLYNTMFRILKLRKNLSRTDSTITSFTIGGH